MYKLLLVMILFFSSSIYAKDYVISPLTSTNEFNHYAQDSSADFDEDQDASIVPGTQGPSIQEGTKNYLPEQRRPNRLNPPQMFNQDEGAPPLPNDPYMVPDAGVKIETSPDN